MAAQTNGAGQKSPSPTKPRSRSRSRSSSGNKASKPVVYQEVSDDELIAMQVLRERITIPEELNTNYNLARWLRSHDMDLDNCERELRNYINSRTAAGFDDSAMIAHTLTHPLSQRYLPYFSVSCLADQPINKKDNAIVFFQKMEGVNFHELIKVIRVGDILYMYFMYNEYYLKLLLDQEKKTEKPSSCQVVFDLTNFHLSEYMNPMGPAAKIGKLLAHIWQGWYGEQISKILVYNPPRLVSMVYQLAKLILNKRLQSRICLVHNADQLKQIIGPECVPAALGGTLKDTTGWSKPDECLNKPKEITSLDHFAPGRLWNCLEQEPEVTKHHVKRHKTVEIVKISGQTDSLMLYQFKTSADILFCVYYAPSDDPKQDELVHPKFIVNSVRLPEEGIVQCKKAGNYKLQFTNSTNWLSVTIELACAIVPPGQVPEDDLEYYCFNGPSLI